MIINYRYLSFGVVIFSVAFIIFSLNIGTKPNVDNPSIFAQTPQSDTLKPIITNPQNTAPNIQSKAQPNLTSDQPKNPFNSNNFTKAAIDEYDPNLPPGFPEPLPPLDKERLKQTDELITEGDAIIAEMDTLIAGLDLPQIKLSKSEQAKLDSQRQIQQIQLEDIRDQLEALKQDL